MTVLSFLIPVSLALGGLWLGAFLWSLRSEQYRDLEGDQHRTLFGEHDDSPPS
ncbi:MAG: cbb3-type cytochrome oxidase assembly protein CcoS [Pseudomonadota bacterium]